MATQSSKQTPEKRNGRAVVLFIAIAPLIAMAALMIIAFQTSASGDVVTCEKALADGTVIRLSVEPFSVSGVPHESHIFTAQPTSGDAITIVDMAFPSPSVSPNCDDNIDVDGDIIWIWDSKTAAVSAEAGQTWHLWEVCDAPRPEFGCVASEQIESVSFAADGIGEIAVFALEGSYKIVSDDGGMTWQIAAP